jgi:hypothetical protein
MQRQIVLTRCFALAIVFLCAAHALAQPADNIIKITVSTGATPTFSWTPDSTIGRLIVEEDDKELWSTETEGENLYRSPIRYGVHPPGAAEDESAFPLVAGHTYTIKLFRWISVKPERFQLLGVQKFTPAAAEAEEDEDEPVSGIRPTLRINALAPDYKFDGGLLAAKNGDGRAAGNDSIANLITIEPVEGEAPEGRTVVKVFANQNDIIVEARCYDNEPENIVSFSKARDADLSEEDHILIVLDTFLDGRSGYVFAVNPSGARFDGLVIEQGEDVNSDWDAVWQAKTLQDHTGWYAEIRIPIKSLGFKKDLDTWGFNVQRRVQRLQETSRWSGASRDFEIYQTSRAGLLTNMPSFDFGVGMSIRASTVGSVGKPGSDEDVAYNGDFSLDVTQRLGPNLLSALTINTDFAETEVDVRQINLTRFDLFFPEKRTFFLQGSDIFQFGVALDEATFSPFFSRHIGLVGAGEDDLVEIPIDAGGKINGRVGNTNIAALVVNTREIDSLDVGDVDEEIKIHVPDATMGVLRINQNILEESSVGMMATFGDQLGRADSWSGGVDFTYRTSEFLDEKNFLINVWGLLNGREDLEGEKSAFGFRIDYPNDVLDMNLSSLRIGDGFEPSLAFVPRNDVHIWNFSTEISARPQWPLVREMRHELSLSLYNDLDNSAWQSYELTIQPLNWILESGDSFEASVTPQGDRPPEAFELATDTDVPSGSYEWTRYFLGARSAGKRRVSAEILWEFGNYYNGDLNTLEARLALKPSAFMTLEFTAERNTGTVMALPDDVEEEDAIELVETDFTEELLGVRLLLNFSPDLQLSSFTQYDTESKELGSNNRLRWTFDPLGDIFIVYNYNWLRRRNEIRGVDEWEFVSSEVPLKIQYAYRF